MSAETPDREEDAVAFFRSLTPDQVTAGIAKAIEARDFEAVVVLLKVLAVKDPHKASVVYGSMMAVAKREPIHQKGSGRRRVRAQARPDPVTAASPAACRFYRVEWAV